MEEKANPCKDSKGDNRTQLLFSNFIRVLKKARIVFAYALVIAFLIAVSIIAFRLFMMVLT